jgi:hypothetical protein
MLGLASRSVKSLELRTCDGLSSFPPKAFQVSRAHLYIQALFDSTTFSSSVERAMGILGEKERYKLFTHTGKNSRHPKILFFFLAAH